MECYWRQHKGLFIFVGIWHIFDVQQIIYLPVLINEQRTMDEESTYFCKILTENLKNIWK